MNSNNESLGSERIGKLIIKFSIPCIVSLIINAIYNIVDQIFIGQGVGTLANGATNVVFLLQLYVWLLRFYLATAVLPL